MIDFIINVTWLLMAPIIIVYLAIEAIRDTRQRAAREKEDEVEFERKLTDCDSSLPVVKEDSNGT